MQFGRIAHLLKNSSASLSRRTTLKATGAALAASAVAAPGFPSVAAQNATPDENRDRTTELLGVGFPGDGQEAIQLIRFTFVPGGTSDPHLRPGSRIDYVESGTWGVTVVEGNVELQPAGGDRTTDREVLAPGSEYILEVGDSLFIDEGAAVASRAVGDEPLVLLVSASSPADSLSTEEILTGAPEATPDS